MAVVRSQERVQPALSVVEDDAPLVVPEVPGVTCPQDRPPAHGEDAADGHYLATPARRVCRASPEPAALHLDSLAQRRCSRAYHVATLPHASTVKVRRARSDEPRTGPGGRDALARHRW